MNTNSVDIGPLTWVKGEIDLALDRAGDLLHTAGNGDKTVISQAAAQLHQAHGALAIVGLEGITQYSEALEQLFTSVESGEVEYTAKVAEAAEQGLFTIRHYLDDLVAGNPDQPLKLYPHYCTLLTLRGQPTPPESDLFYPDLSLRPPKRDSAPVAPEDLVRHLKTARMDYQRGLLKWLRGNGDGLAEMRKALDQIEGTQSQPARRTLWWAAQGLIDALYAAGTAADNTQLRKLNARLDVQIRKLIEGSSTIAERLLRDVLYQVAVAPAGSEHLECVRAAFQLDQQLPSRHEGSDDDSKRPIVAQLRDLLGNAKDDWNRFSSGTAAALPRFHQRIDESCVLAVQLGHEGFISLVNGISDIAETLRRDPLRHNEMVAIEIATALLLAESGMAGYPTLGADFPIQVDATVARLGALNRGESLDELALPQLDAITRKAQERLLMAQVVREISANLATIEQALDAFFRNPAQKEGLSALRKPLDQVGGALAVLGQENAAALLHECELKIKGFDAATELRQEDFEEVASKLSALGFFVEQLRHGPADLEAILNPRNAKVEEDETIEASFDLNKRLTQTLIGALREQPGSSEIRDELKQQLETLREDAQLIADDNLEQQLNTAITALDDNASAPDLEEAIAALVETPEVIAPSAETMRLANASSEDFDAELLGIFLEEANEVLGTLAETLPIAERDPHDAEAQTTIRRSFHTLKGSGRMVGLNALGETAWAVEQVMNHWLQQEADGTPSLMQMLEEAQTTFAAWVVRLEQGDLSAPDTASLISHCQRLLSGKVEEELAPAIEESIADAYSAESNGAKVIDFPSAPAMVEIGPLSLTPMLFDTYTGEARSHVDALQEEFAALDGMPSEPLVRAAHTLAGISATVGILPVHTLVSALEDALTRYARAAQSIPFEDRTTIARAIGAIDGMIGAIAGRRMPSPDAALEAGLAALVPPAAPTSAEPDFIEPVFEKPEALETLDILDSSDSPAAEIESPPGASTPQPAETTPEAAAPIETQAASAGGMVEELEFTLIDDEIDPQLLPIFMEESADLMQGLGTALREWRQDLGNKAAGDALQRQLHTLKGSARMAGAMTLGELLHAMETRAEHGLHMGAQSSLIDTLDAAYDRAAHMLDRISRGEPALEPAIVAAATEAVDGPASHTISLAGTDKPTAPDMVQDGGTASVIRVRAGLVDDLVNNSGEIAITRSRIEGEIRTVKESLLDLTENVIRLRGQLREIEIQAESQMQSQQAMTSEHSADFDPLEFDRFTRFQELTRLMAESVNDVSTVQHNLLRNLENTDAALVAQARLNRELSQSLMSVRMVPFNSVADRLYRIVRQASKDTGKRASLDIRGAQTELDRSVLDNMIGPIEHLLRNAIAHGLETGEARKSAGKSETGEVTITVAQTGNEISIVLQDDGAGLNFERIRATGEARGLVSPGDMLDEPTLIELIFAPGFSTMTEVTALAGRGIGMDVVKSEVQNLGGRIEVDTTAGHGSRFTIFLPLTLAVAQGVLVRVGLRTYILPAGMVSQVSELKPAAIETVRKNGHTEWQGISYAYHYLPHLLGMVEAQPEPARRHWLMLLQAGAQHVALEVDALLGNQEIVVKNIGPQLARVPGIVGATVLGDGEIALILNPVALASHKPRSLPAPQAIAAVPEEAVAVIPTVLVVDDSLTVRKITGRLLERSGYRVVTAKDGIDALEQMVELVPDVMLVDIEMPRMDGFDLTRNVRADTRLKAIPIIMITSRTAEKHRNYAAEIGVNHYLGKPYDEDELLRLIKSFTTLLAAG
jgi:chemosensory pili system protein ChpA (sensor histidine kinase/response regulator)